MGKKPSMAEGDSRAVSESRLSLAARTLRFFFASFVVKLLTAKHAKDSSRAQRNASGRRDSIGRRPKRFYEDRKTIRFSSAWLDH